MDGDEPRQLDAGTLVGLLADDDRRSVVAALTLGATSLDEVVRRAGLPTDRAGKALARLVDGGLVVTGDGAALVVLGAAFGRAARSALGRSRSTEHDDRPADVRRVFDAFVRDDRITSIPTARTKRLVLLDWLAQDFEPGRRYTEREVNAMLHRRHPDTATWRRYLVDEEFLERGGGEYWRAGGTVRVLP